MSLTNEAENNLLLLLFNNTTWANIGDGTGIVHSTTPGSFYISLHTGDPGEGGDQTTSEATYTGYARQAVARSSAGFTVSGTNPTQVQNAALVGFPACSGGSSTCTFFGIGTLVSGSGHLLLSGSLTSLIVTNGITPSFAINDLTVTLD